MGTKYRVGEPFEGGSLLSNKYWQVGVTCDDGEGEWLFATVYGLTKVQTARRALKLVSIIGGRKL